MSSEIPSKRPSLALYQPDIPQNLGAALRLCACLGVTLHIIEPCGFPLDDRKIKRVGMDYMEHLQMIRHASWERFYEEYSKAHSLVLMTTKASKPYTSLAFTPDTILIAGRESAGVPDHVNNSVHQRTFIPMAKGTRSMNVINASAMILGESLRQTNNF